MKGYRILAFIIAIFMFLSVPIKAGEVIPKTDIRNKIADTKFEREQKLTQMINQTMGIFLFLSVSSIAMTVHDIHSHQNKRKEDI